MNCACVYLDERLGSYGFGEGHPFGPDRQAAFQRAFEQRGLDRQTRVLPATAGTYEQLARFHTPEYLTRLQQASKHGQGWLDQGDTPAFKGIWEAALAIAGSVCAAADRTMSGECRRALVPIAGLHHARRDSAAGFCAINDCGVVIEHLRACHQIRRIAYIDIDAHHGDGVFYHYEDDPDIIIVDFHEDGRFLYPGTGRMEESGRGIAAGTKLNVPLPPAADDAVFETLWTPAEEFLTRHPADFYLLQAGADSLQGDPITHLALSPATHRRVTQRLLACFGYKPLLVLGGGGYNRDNLAAAWCAVVEALIQEPC